MPFEWAIVGVESGLLFITLADADQVVCMVEVNFQIDSCLAQAVEEVGDAG